MNNKIVKIAAHACLNSSVTLKEIDAMKQVIEAFTLPEVDEIYTEEEFVEHILYALDVIGRVPPA